MAVAGHRVFPVLVLWLLVQLTHSGSDAMGYRYIQCSRHELGGPSERKRQDDVTVQWCLAFCGAQDPAYGYGGLRRTRAGSSNADCYCLTTPGRSFGATRCGTTCGDHLQCGGRQRPSYVSVYQDVNECLTNNGGCNQTCVNSPGSFSCQCREGYDKTGMFCTDINECAIDNGGCDHNCTNTPGGYNCSCLDGYVSDNTTCTDIDECADAAIHNCSPTDECRNTDGSFQCIPKAVDTTVSSTVTEIEGIVCRSSTTPPVWMYALLGILMAVVLAMGVVIFMLWRRRAGPNDSNNAATASRPLDPHPGCGRTVPASPAAVSWEDRPTDLEVSDSQYEHIKIYTNSEAAQGVYEKME